MDQEQKQITDFDEIINPSLDDIILIVVTEENINGFTKLGNLPLPDSVVQALSTKQAILVSGQNIKTINGLSLLGSGNLAISGGEGGGGSGTVTSVNFTLGNAGTDLSSNVVNATTTPQITLNVPTAGSTNRGVLSPNNWNTFNNKQDVLTLTTTGTSGPATLLSNILNIPQYGGGGGFSNLVIDYDYNIVGLKNGQNTNFSTTVPYKPGTTRVYLNGQRLTPGAEYDYLEISTTQIGMFYAPVPSDSLIIEYETT